MCSCKLCFTFTLFLTSHPWSSLVEPWSYEHAAQMDIVTSYRKFSFSQRNIPITIASPYFRGHLLLPIKNSRQLQKIPAFLYCKGASPNTLQYLFFEVWLSRNFTLSDQEACKPHSKLTLSRSAFCHFPAYRVPHFWVVHLLLFVFLVLCVPQTLADDHTRPSLVWSLWPKKSDVPSA